MLEAALGTTRLLARPGDRRLWLLDAGTAALWDLQAAGWTGAPLAGLLAERFGLAPEDAHRYLDELQAQWHAAGLLEADREGGRFAAAPTEPPLASPPATAPRPGPGGWRWRIGRSAWRSRIRGYVPCWRRCSRTGRAPTPARPRDQSPTS